MRIVPVSGSPIYLTDHPRDLVMSGHTYLSTAGYEFTGYSSTAGFSPSAIDLPRHRRRVRRHARRRRLRPVRRRQMLRFATQHGTPG